MSIVGRLTAIFRLDTKQAEAGAKRLERSLGKDLESSLRGMTGGAGIAGNALASLGTAGLAAGAGIGALAGAVGFGIRHLTQLGDEITTMSAKTGVSTDFLQKLKFATEKLDVPFQSAVKAISKFQANVGRLTPTKEATDALSQLGLTIGELKNLNPEEQFETLTRALDKLTNQSERAAVAQALFGRAGIELLPLLNRDYRALTEQAEKLGLVISEDLLVAGDELEENWAVLKTVLVTLAAQAVGPLTIKLNELAVAWVLLIQEAKEHVGTLQDQMEQEGQLQDLIESGVSQKEIEVILFERRRQAAIDYRDELQEQAKAEFEASLAAKAEAEASDASAASRVRDKIAIKEQGAEFAKLAKSVGLSVAAFDEEDDAFKRVAKSMMVAEAVEKSRTTILAGLTQRQSEYAASLAETEFRQRAYNAALEAFPQENILVSDVLVVPGIGGLEDVSKTIQDSVVPGIGDIEAATEKAAEAQRQYNEALAAANDLAQLLGGTIGSIVGQTLAAGAALQNLQSLGGSGGLLGGIKGAFSEGKGGAGGIAGLLGGISGVLAAAGPLIGIGLKIGGFLVKGIKSLLGGPDIARDVARDLGANISKELAASIKASGRPAQLAIADIIREGALSADRAAEEIGDLFSFFGRGEISKPELITALEQSIPLLISNFEELGPAGEEQIRRITAEAERLGIHLEEIDRLIQSTFASDTLETMADKFGLSTLEIREMSKALGIDIQTDLERIAATVGLTAKEFKAMGAALEEQFGVPAEQLAEFLESTGISAAELAEQLGVNVGEGAQAAADAQELANGRLMEGADLASRIADELERAARASGGISFVGGSVPGAAHGEIVTGPSLRVVGEGGEAEVIAPVRALFDSAMKAARGGGGGPGAITVTNHIKFEVNVRALAAGGKNLSVELAPVVNEMLNDGRLKTEIVRGLEGIFQKR